MHALDDEAEAGRAAIAAEKERQLQEQIANQAAEKEKRVEHLCGMILRRILKKDLSRGWTAWHEMWSIESHQRRLLQGAGFALEDFVVAEGRVVNGSLSAGVAVESTTSL